MSAQPAIVLEDLAKAYRVPPSGARGARRPGGLVWALAGLTFQVAPGEGLALVGRNGAGKSTLLRILARIVAPTRGRATLCGRVTGLLEVGTGFHPELTGRENAILNAAIHGLSLAQARRSLDAMVAFADVERFLDLPLKHWSSGMALRLAFAVAAHLEPDVLLLDEVLAVGDAGFRERCLDSLNALRARGTALLLVSHDAPTVRRLCTRTAWLEAGALAALGPTEQVLEAYARAAPPTPAPGGPGAGARAAT